MKFSNLQFSSFNKNIVTLFKGTVIAQIISVIGVLFLANIYSSELYGYYNVFLSFVGILSIINSLKFEYIIVTEISDRKSINTINSLILIILLISIFHLAFFSIFKSYFSKKDIAFGILIFSIVSSFFLSNYKLLESFSTRKSLFKIISNARIIMAISTVLLQFILFYLTKNGLIYGYTISIVITFLFYFYKFKKIYQFPKLNLFKKTILSHINIIQFAFPSSLINGIAMYIMPILMLSYFSASTSGVYALSLKIVSIPLFLISSSVSQVYFQKASEHYNNAKNKLFRLTKNIVIINILVMITSLLLINTLGLYFLNLFFDQNWNNLSAFIIILSFFTLCQSAFAPISSIIVITNKMHIGLIFNISLVLINFIAIYFGTIYNNILLTVIILSTIGGLGYIFLLFYFLNLLKTYTNE